MNILKIARDGIKGRKKDNFLLQLVISLTFIFIIMAMLLETSVEKTKENQRIKLYGGWQAAYLGADNKILNQLSGDSRISGIGVNQLLGTSDTCGVVGTLDDSFLSMGNFTLYKGRYPEADNEIMLEINQFNNLNLELEIGQEIEVDMNQVLVMEDIHDYASKRYQELTGGTGTVSESRHINNEEEIIDDMKVSLNNEYYFMYVEEGEGDPETIRKEGFLYSQKLTVKKKFIVTGIIYTYSDKWDLAGHTSVNAFVTKHSGSVILEAMRNTTLLDNKGFDVHYNLFLVSNSLGDDLYDKLVADDSYLTDGDTSVLRRNTYSYPRNAGSTEGTLTLLILGIIFIASSCAVFQIFFTQMRRRVRKIALMKSIGATNMQVIQLLFYEGVHHLLVGLFSGVIGGFLLSYGVIAVLNRCGRALSFHVSYKLLSMGILSGCVALFLGMAIPMLFALHIPLVGAIKKPPKHKKKRNRKTGTSSIREIHKQSFSYISWRDFKRNKWNELLSFGLTFLTVTLGMAAVFLCYLSFQKYQDTVVMKNRPDYTMENYYGERTKDIKVMEEELEAIPGVKKVTSYKIGENVCFWYDGIAENRHIQAFESALPNVLLRDHFSKYDSAGRPMEYSEKEYLQDSMLQRIYGIPAEGELYDQFCSALTIGSINQEEFRKGKEVILLIPLSKALHKEAGAQIDVEEVQKHTTKESRMKWLLAKNGIFSDTYNKRYASYYDMRTDIKPGNTIILSANKETQNEMGVQVEGHYTQEVNVGGIIYYFPDSGIWPFSDTVEEYAIIGSYNAMEELYPSSRFGRYPMTYSQMKAAVEMLYPHKYGKTYFMIEMEEVEDIAITDSKLLSYANEHDYTLHNYRESNERLFSEALNNAVIIGLLGICSAMIVSIILKNTLVSKIEQDATRIGILQSIGVTKKQFRRHYLLRGMLYGTVSIILANMLLFIVLLFTSFGAAGDLPKTFGYYLSDVFMNRLYGYPYSIHFAVCAIFLLLTIWMHYHNSKHITSRMPIDNIRNLSR